MRYVFAACIDHRGTPESPARTCTLEEKEGAICVSVLLCRCSASLLSFDLFSCNSSFFLQWGTAYCVRGGPEKEKLAMQVKAVSKLAF